MAHSALRAVKRVGRRFPRLRHWWGQLRWYSSPSGMRQLVSQARHFGWRVTCPFCGWHGSRFFSAGYVPRANAQCPRCYSLERHRLLALYLQRHPELIADGARVLEVGPRLYFKYFFGRRPAVRYVSTDIESPYATYHSDVMALPVPAQAFDVTICYHVLCEVPDDRAALREIHRALKPGGTLLVHESITRDVTTDFDASVSPEERGRLCSDTAAQRGYGKDFAQRVASTGFSVNVVPYAAQLPSAELSKYGLVHDDVVYVCHRLAA